MWQLELEGLNNGHTNMARDVVLLDAAENGTPACRVYGWDGPWVSLGRFQNEETAVLASSSVPCVLRPTGGKAVLHGHDVTVGLAAPLSAIGLEEGDHVSVRQVYRRIIGPLISALRACGVPAALGEQTPFVRGAGKTADCFAHVAPNDVVDERTGRKVCGCALKVTSRAVLVQASIPAGEPLVDPHMVFAHPHVASASKGLDRDAYAQALRIALTAGLVWLF